jgi:hypothetical protein
MTTDTIERIAEEAELLAELEELRANKPEYFAPSDETDPILESGKRRAIISTAVEIPLWNVETGEKSMCIFDALGARLGQRFPPDHPNKKFANKRVYTRFEKDAPKPARGTLPCPLSADSDRAEVTALGFGHIYCPKPACFFTSLDVDLHVEKSHKRFYRIRNEERARRERQEDRDRQDALLRAVLAGNMQSGPVLNYNPKTGTVFNNEDVLPSEPGPLDEAELTCECGWVSRKDSKNPAASLNTHKRMHCPLKDK